MATYRLSVSLISRGGAGSGSAIASAAYRAAERLVERGREWVVGAVAVAAASYRSGSEMSADEGQSYDFTRKRGVVHSEIALPDGAPVWMGDRERLWNAVEASETRSNSRLARETQLALPRELDSEAQLELVREFVAEQMVGRGMVADFAIHDVKARDGGRNQHAHVMTTTRAVDPTKPLGFGAKVREWDDVSLVVEWREAWADHVNRALEAEKIHERVDHRTLEAQRQEAVAAGDFERAAAFDREPEPKVGPQAWALERDGIATDRGDMLREVQERNAARAEVYEQVAEHGHEARARFLEIRERAGDALEAFVAWGDEVLEHARVWTRGAMVAAGIGATALGLLPERDSFQPPEASVEVTAPATPREERAKAWEKAEMDQDMEQLIREMDGEAVHEHAATQEVPEHGPKAEELDALQREDAELKAEAEDAEMAEILAAMDAEVEAEREQGLEIGE